MLRGPAIGIDLGTTDSCVAVFHNGHVEIIPNETGNITTPSFVAFTPTGRLIGESAKNQAATNPDNTMFGVKRLIGRRYHDVEANLKQWPFKVINDGGKPKILVKYKGLLKHLCAEEVSAMILSNMKEVAEAYLGTPVQSAVITVPSYFNNAQREATKDAATIAGLQDLRIINEPTAAAVAYGFDKRVTEETTVLIFDLGGGTCNVSILTQEDTIFEVKSTAGNNNLGGEDFDERMMKHFIGRFKLKHGKDLSQNKRALNRLRLACEKAKKVLSCSKQAVVELDSLFEGIDFDDTITRKQFEDINSDLFRDVLKPVQKSLEDAKMQPHQINDVILVGGSTRIPYIQSLLREFFNGKELNRSMNSFEAVACGAAIQAAILCGDKSENLQEILLLDVIPLSLGTETENGVMTTLIARNSSIPTLAQYSCTCKGPSKVFKVYEGERAMVKDNYLLANFELQIPPVSTDVDINLSIDANNILDVYAVDRHSAEKYKVLISGSNRLKREEIERMIRNAEIYRRDDDIWRQTSVARNNLESCCYNMKQHGHVYLTEKCDEVLAWLDNCPDSTDQRDFEQKQKELECLFGRITSKETANTSDNVEETCANGVVSVEGSFDDLKCGLCNKYLSYFPIFLCIDKTAACGRCLKAISDNKFYIQNASYESLAKKLKFPCIYQSEGCLEKLSPVDVPQHEWNCTFRSISCKKCTWEGAVCHLLQHFEQEHPDDILRSGRFRVNFMQTYEIHNLLIYKDELFGLKRYFDHHSKLFNCSLVCYNVLGSNSKYNYQITLSNGTNKDYRLNFPPKPVDCEEHIIEISVEEVLEKLKDPALIVGTVKIEDITSVQESKPDKIYPEVNYDLLTQLECPVCFDYIVPPIYQCIAGHSICQECKPKILECPTCKREIQNIHNITLEKMAQLLIYPCKFAEQGCTVTSKSEEIKKHQKYCPFGLYSCPLKDYTSCQWKKSLKLMFDHVTSCHRDLVLSGNTVSTFIDSNYYNREDASCFIIKYDESLFRLQYLYKKKVFYWTVQLIGPPEDAKKYQFEIDICDNSGSKRRMFLRSFCGPLAKRDCGFEGLDVFVFMKLEQIRSFITDIFAYKVYVTC